MKKFLSKYWAPILILLLGLSVSWPLFKYGYFSHQDDLQVMRIFEMRKCFTDLQLPCRWVPDMGWGNGMPLFNFYGVSSYYLGAVASYFLGYIGSAKLLFFLALTVGSFGIYLLVNRLWGRWAGLTAGVLYLFAPYKALDVYVRGALAESIALSIIPFVFYFGYRLITSGKKRDFILFTITLFAFAITHNIMTLIFIPVLVVWLVYWLWVEKWKQLKIVLLSLLLGMGLSSFFVVPAFFEKNLVQTESLTRFELNFRANYLQIKQLFFDRAWGFGTSVPGPEGRMSFQIGWPHWWLVLISLALIFIAGIKKQSKLLAAGLILAFLLSIFMTHNKSTFIWENVNLLTFFQFPWRFLSLSIFTASLLGGFVVGVVRGRWQRLSAVVIIVLAVALNWSYFKPQKFYPVNDSQKLSGVLWEDQRKGALLDYLPKTALEPREAAQKQPLIRSGEAEITKFDIRSNRWSFSADVKSDALIEVPVYYFPNWSVKVNGQNSFFTYKNYTGRISVGLPVGSYTVEGSFYNTPIRSVANSLSLLSLIIFLYIVFYKKIMKRSLSKYIFPVILILSIPAVRYLFVKGFFGVSDDMHIAWLYEMDKIIRAGQFPPRFVPDLSYGFGYPLFNFVYPLPYYFGEIFHLLGLSLVDSIKTVFILSIPLSMYAMYRFLKEFLPQALALAGAVLYVYAPYRATEMFVRGTIGEIIAFVFIPLVALSFVKITQNKNIYRWIGISGLAIAGLVLSHNIMAYMFMPFAFALLLARIIWLARDKKKAILQSLAAIILGLLVSSYFWIPAIRESGLMKYSTIYNFYDHFPTIKQLITPYFGYGASDPGSYDIMSFYIGIVSLIVVVMGTLLIFIKRKKISKEEKIFAFWGLIIFIISIFMMNYRSAFLWRIIPFLPYFQFPWRFLAMVTFASPVLLLGLSKLKHQTLISLIVIIFAIVLNFSYFKYSEFLGRGDDYYLNRYIPVPVASQEYKNITDDYLRLPSGTDTRPDKNYPLVYGAMGVIKSFNETSPLSVTISTDYSKDSTLNYSKYYFPGWIAKIDGKSTEIKIGKPFGQITVDVPAGKHTIEIKYTESKPRLIFDFISLGSLALALYFIFKKQ